MNQIDYQPTQPASFSPAPAFAPQAQLQAGHSFLSRNSSLGPQAFPQPPASYAGPPKQLAPHNGGPVGGAAFAFPASGLNVNVNGALTSNVSPPQQQQHHQQLGGQQLPFSSAPYSQSISLPGVTAAGPLGATHSASPFHVSSPHATAFTQLSPRGHSQMQQSPMAPPPNHLQASPQTPARPQSQPRSPRSPATLAREKARMELLLDINNELLQELQNLQAQGKGGAPTQEHADLFKKQGLNVPRGSPEFVQVFLRVHANLGYLCGASDHALKPDLKQAPHPPNYVQAPPAMPQLAERYQQLRALFPGWSGMDAQAAQQMRTGSTSFSASGSPAASNASIH